MSSSLFFGPTDIALARMRKEISHVSRTFLRITVRERAATLVFESAPTAPKSRLDKPIRQARDVA